MGFLVSRFARMYGMPYSAAQRLLHDMSLILGFVLLALAFHKYTTLTSLFVYRERVIHVFNEHFAPFVVAHVLIFALLLLVFRIRPRTACLYWLVTAVWLLALGGPERALAFSLLAVYAAFLLLIGMAIGDLIVEPDSRSLGLYLALGIGAVASLVPYLAWFHILYFWVLLLLFAGALLLSILRMKRQLRQRISSAWKEVQGQWTAGLALGIEIAVVIAAYLVVASSPPETNADAVRFYWPYIRWMERLGGFVHMPYQWSYVIPQAGIGFSSTVFILFGTTAVRWTMLLVWVALVGLAARTLWPRAGTEKSEAGAAAPSEGTLTGVGLGIAAVVAACPTLLLASCSLATDTFVSMVTVLMAVVLIGGRRPESVAFWVLVGALFGLNWSAKFTTIAYATPLCLIALARALKLASFRRVPLYFGASLVGILLTAGPWLWNSYKLSGNPIFPLLYTIFPSEVWPYRSGIGNLADFQMRQGWWQKITMPLDMTFKTGLYVEGYHGVLGLALVLFLILGVPALRRSSWRSWGVFGSGVFGTLALWQMTTYVRYWLPGLWLIGLGLAPGAAAWIKGRRVRVVFVFVSGAIAVYQILFAMSNMWSDPDGWPWKYYRGGFTDETYLERGFPGFQGLRKVPELNQGWPKVWFTTAGIVGHLPVLPLEAAIWEMNSHVEPGWRARVRYLSAVGCRYWVVNEATGDEVWLRATGLGRFFWDEKLRIARTGPYGVFRMTTADEIFRAVDSNTSPGAELLADGGFESVSYAKPVFWMNFQNPTVQSDPAGAKKDSRYAVVNGVNCWVQVVPIPREIRRVALSAWMKRAAPEQASAGQLLLNWVDAEGKVIGVKTQAHDLGSDWAEYEVQMEVPKGAETASVYAAGTAGTGSVHVDELHFRVID
ncbi:MAG: hypothetical protein ACE15E_17370 [Acidobacteriota bacterium]